jgi:DNA-binding CsgD family transcriptional regulator
MAFLAWHEGRVADALGLIRAAVRRADQAPRNERLNYPRLGLVSMLVAINEIEEAESVARSEIELLGGMLWTSAPNVFTTGALVEARDGPVMAVAALAAVYGDPYAYRRLFIETPAAAAWLVRTAVAAGEHAKAEAIVVCAEQLAAQNHGFPTLSEDAAHARALLERDPTALARCAGGRRAARARASAAEDAGVEFGVAGDRQAARTQLQRAIAAYDEAGAEPDGARVRRRLRALGDRRRRRAEEPLSGWASLTETEESVARHVADGMTNREVAEHLCLSRHTVDFHLRQIFRKLVINSRVQLTRVAIERCRA